MRLFTLLVAMVILGGVCQADTPVEKIKQENHTLKDDIRHLKDSLKTNEEGLKSFKSQCIEGNLGKNECRQLWHDLFEECKM